MSVFSGKQFKGAKRALKENKKLEALARQAAFDSAYLDTTNQNQNRDKVSRKEFGLIRHVERVSKPKIEVTL